MNGLGFLSGGFRHSFGGSAGGSGQCHFVAQLPENPYQRPDHRGFTGAGTAGQNHHARGHGQKNRLFLHGGIDQSAFRLDQRHLS